jgi:hypothetical protein
MNGGMLVDGRDDLPWECPEVKEIDKSRGKNFEEY